MRFPGQVRHAGLQTLVFVAVIGLAVLVGGLEIWIRLQTVPNVLRERPAASLEFVDREGAHLRTLLVEERMYVRWMGLGEVPRHVIDATLAAEDKRFFEHRGVDPLATARAAVDFLKTGSIQSGASTITQQLIKMASRAPRSLLSKVWEIFSAVSLERRWSKDKILEEYLNRLDYGSLQIGIASASRFYFAKSPADLSIAEAAFLAGLPNAPTRLNPISNFDAARSRQLAVLHRMLANGSIDQPAYDRAAGEPLDLVASRQNAASPFVDLLLHRRGLNSPDGGVIETTIDRELNRRAEKILQTQLGALKGKQASAGAAVVLHNPTGEVLAMAAVGDAAQTDAWQINGAWSVRSPGSAVKPFAFILAMEGGACPATVVADVPSEFQTPTGLYRPNNYNHRFYGPVSLRFALANSLNIAAIKVLQLGGGPGKLQRLLGDLGVTTLGHPPEHYGLGLVLGNGEVRLLELCNAYAAIARMGVAKPYRLLKRHDAPGTVGRRLFSKQSAWLVTDVLSDNAARSTAFGENSWLRFPFPVACKTGTSSDYRDNWTIAYTPEFTVGVWVGNPDGSPMRDITGVTGAAPIAHQLLSHLHATRGTSWFPQPEGIAEVPVHPVTGKRAASFRKGFVMEKCFTLPPMESSGDYDAQGRVILPPEYDRWLAGPHNSLGNLVSESSHAGSLAILEPKPGTVYLLDPDLPDDAQLILLKARSVGEVAWSSTTLACEESGSRASAKPREGVHVLIVQDALSGESASTWIEVKSL